MPDDTIVVARSIEDLGEKPILEDLGKKDDANTQIFTPDFVVKDMIRLCGNEYVTDISTRILEPSSGDGAFTVRILEMRLKAISKSADVLKKSLIALSTLYSIEMDKSLIEKQRNNIFSLFCIYSKKHNPPSAFYDLAKLIIATNFIWGETNIKTDLVQSVFGGPEVGWYMPSDSLLPIKFAVWTIFDDLTYEMRLEDIDI